MRILALLAVCAGCGDYLQTLAPVDDTECFGLEMCPLAVGTDVMVSARGYSDVDELEVYKDAYVAPPGLVRLEPIDSNLLVVHPLEVGTGVIGATIGRGESEHVVELEIRVAAIASTRIAARSSLLSDAFPDAAYPAGKLALFSGTTLHLHADHRDSTGQHLLGHGVESWTSEGGQLLVPPRDNGFDPGLDRDLLAGPPGVVRVSADELGALEIDVVAPGATASLALTTSRLRVAPNEMSGTHVLAMTADGTPIVGPAPDFAVTSSDPHVLRIEDIDPADHAFRFVGQASGTATVTITFDGVTTTTVFDVKAY